MCVHLLCAHCCYKRAQPILAPALTPGLFWDKKNPNKKRRAAARRHQSVEPDTVKPFVGEGVKNVQYGSGVLYVTSQFFFSLCGSAVGDCSDSAARA
jgi:hypothetical protein